MMMDQLKDYKPNPFKDYGPGILQYFLMIKLLILVFAFMSLMMSPVIYIYAQGTGYSFLKYIMERVLLSPTLGNMGH